MKNIILLTVLITSSFLLKAQTPLETEYRTKSLNFVLSKLKSPGSAQLVEYQGVSVINPLLIQAGFKLNGCSQVTRVTVDSQNGFGALIRGNYFIFFKNGFPCYLMESQELVATNNGYLSQTENLNLVLEMNGCDCTK